MTGFTKRTSLGLAVCLVSLILLATVHLKAQGTQGEPASHDPDRIQNSTSNRIQNSTSNSIPDSTSSTPTSAEGSAPGNSDHSYGGGLSPNYTLGPEDVITIDVFNVPELSNLSVRVSNDGTLTLPLIGQLKAAGLTADQLRQALHDKWGADYLQNPQVTVFVKEFKSSPVSVIGAVEKPGLYQLTGRRTLIEMLSMAGGLATKSTAAAGSYLCVIRKGGFGDLEPVEGMEQVGDDQLQINIKRLLYSHDNALNIEIEPSDVISVSKADIVYVVGAVKLPGGFVVEDREHVTVMQAVAMAQGFGPSPAKKAARIIRTNTDGTKSEIPLDVGKIFKGQAPDTVLAANDILYIPTSNGKNAAKIGSESALGLVTGLLIYGRI